MIFLGKVIKTKGNKGEVVVSLSPGLWEAACTFLKGEAVVLKSTKYRRECRVEYSRESGSAPVIKFSGIDTINDALKLVGYSIHGTRTGEQNGQSSGLAYTYTVEDTAGHLWGKVKGMGSPGSNRILEVEDRDGDIIYVPFADGIVKKIDREKKVITIDPPEGLRGLNK